MQALREIGFRVYGIGKPQPQTDAETTSAEATARGRKRCPNPNPNRQGSEALPTARRASPAVLAQRAEALPTASRASPESRRLLCGGCHCVAAAPTVPTAPTGRLLCLLGRRLPARRLLLCGGGWAGIWAAPPSSATRLLVQLGGNSPPG